MTTLGVSAVGLGIATLMFAGVQPNIADDDAATAGRSSGSSASPTSPGSPSACVLVGWLVQRYSRLGRYAFAIGGAEEVLALPA